MSVLKEALNGFIGSSNVIEKAANIGVSATATSLSRYQKEGLMLLPNRDSLKGLQGRPANYHPLCICELAAATWMYKGFFPSLIDPQKKVNAIARFSTEDILFARAKFYLSSAADVLVSKYNLPEFSLLEYQIPGENNSVSYIAYKDFLAKRVLSMESEIRRNIVENEKEYFEHESRKRKYFLEILDDSFEGLSTSSAIDALSKKEYAVSAYRLLYYRSFYMLEGLDKCNLKK